MGSLVTVYIKYFHALGLCLVVTGHHLHELQDPLLVPGDIGLSGADLGDFLGDLDVKLCELGLQGLELFVGLILLHG